MKSQHAVTLEVLSESRQVRLSDRRKDRRRVAALKQQLRDQPSFLELVPPEELALARSEFQVVPEAAGLPYPVRKKR